MIFYYGYSCCAFAHNICGSQPEVPDEIPDDTSNPFSLEFFINPRCPPGVIPAKAASTYVHPDEVTNASEREASTAVLETDNSKAGEHLSAVEVRSGKEPAFS